MWAAIGGLVAEIRKCEEVGAYMGALVLCFVCADAMAYLAMPAGQSSQTRVDFISWINTYLMGHPEQLYQYRGITDLNELSRIFNPRYIEYPLAGPFNHR